MKLLSAPVLASWLSFTILSPVFSDTHFTALLTPEAEVPPTSATARGAGVFTLDDTKTQLSFAIGVTGLSGPIIAAHFHLAPLGVPGPVVRNLTPDFAASSSGNAAAGSWTSTDSLAPLTPSLVDDLLAGKLYVNIHTAANGGGEIRGQLKEGGTIDFAATLDGNQETPPVTTGATGAGTFSLNAAGTELAFDISVSGLSGPISAAHFHRAPLGVPGAVVRNITPDFAASPSGNAAVGTWKSTDFQPLTQTQVAELCAENFYVNVHTSEHTGGEIRGQLAISPKAPPVFSNAHFTALLTPEDEVPPTSTAARGAGVFSLDDSKTQLIFAIGVSGLSGPITAAHFHRAPSGVPGPVVRNLTPDFTGNVAVGSWTSTDAVPLTPALVDDLLAGNLYVNVHTEANGGGEIRGQLKAGGTINFTATMDGSHETPPVTTDGKGTGTFSLNAAGTELTFDISVSGLSGPISAAHFHNAPAGVPGPVVRNLTPDFAASPSGNAAVGTWKSTDAAALTRELVAALCAESIYANVHTEANGGGEIRGQLEISTKAPVVEVHDLAITRIKAPRRINLSAKHPTVTKKVIVEIQNRSPQNETIPDLSALQELVNLTVDSINTADGSPPTPTLQGTKKRLPITLKPKKKLAVIFLVTFDHANDALKTSKKSPGHDDFSYTAEVDHSELDGQDDTYPEDDTCPRSVEPPFERDPSLGIKDKGCGAKLENRTFGADVTTDVVQK